MAASSRCRSCRTRPRSSLPSGRGSTRRRLCSSASTGRSPPGGTSVRTRRYVRLDSGSGAACRDGEIVCTRHGATFDSDSGECTHGPYEGAYLEEVDVTVADGTVYLTDEAYEFEGVGPKSDRDLSSGRIGFGGS